MITINTEHVLSANKAAVEAAQAVAEQVLASTEKAVSLNLDMARRTFDDVSSQFQSVLDAKNPKDMVSIQQSLIQPTAEKTIAYSQSLCEIAREGQQELIQLFGTQYGEFKTNASKLFEQLAQSMTADSAAAIDAGNTIVAKSKAKTKAAVEQVAESASENGAAAENIQ